jgi:hypothetical protein
MKMTSLNQIFIQGIIILLFASSCVQAATLQERIYLALPWGPETAQVARWTPKPQDEDQELGGPVDFTIGSDGSVALISNLDTTLKVFTSSGTLSQSLLFNRTNPDRLEGVSRDASGRLALVGLFGPWPHGALEQLRLFKPNLQPDQTINLTTLGVRSALAVEWGTDDHVFIQDNGDFKTWEIRVPNQVIKKVDDENLAWLCSQGRYLFQYNAGRMTVYSLAGRPLAEYPDNGKDLRFIGVTPAGLLYVLFRDPQKGLLLEGLTLEGVKSFSVPVVGSHSQAVLDPDRPHDLRNWRVGFDGAVYATGDPAEDKFRIYRYEIEP